MASRWSTTSVVNKRTTACYTALFHRSDGVSKELKIFFQKKWQTELKAVVVASKGNVQKEAFKQLFCHRNHFFHFCGIHGYTSVNIQVKGQVKWWHSTSELCLYCSYTYSTYYSNGRLGSTYKVFVINHCFLFFFKNIFFCFYPTFCKLL